MEKLLSCEQKMREDEVWMVSAGRQEGEDRHSRHSHLSSDGRRGSWGGRGRLHCFLMAGMKERDKNVDPLLGAATGML